MVLVVVPWILQHHLNLDKPEQHKKEFEACFHWLNVTWAEGKIWCCWMGFEIYGILLSLMNYLTWKVPRFMHGGKKNSNQAFYVLQEKVYTKENTLSSKDKTYIYYKRIHTNFILQFHHDCYFLHCTSFIHSLPYLTIRYKNLET